MKRILLFVLVLSLMLVGCEGAKPELVKTATPTLGVEVPGSAVTLSTLTVVETLVQVVAPPTVPTQDGFQFVERPVTVTPQVIGSIDWNEQLVIDGWVELPGLYPGVKLYYNQSSVGKSQTIENIEVKSGAELVFGAVSATIEVKDLTTGKIVKLSRSGGVYGTVPSGLLIVKMTIVDGFMAMTAASDAQNEFCARVAQTYPEKWALSTTFPNPSWKQPICSGTYKVPVDSDRLHGGTLPYISETPTIK